MLYKNDNVLIIVYFFIVKQYSNHNIITSLILRLFSDSYFTFYSAFILANRFASSLSAYAFFSHLPLSLARIEFNSSCVNVFASVVCCS